MASLSPRSLYNATAGILYLSGRALRNSVNPYPYDIAFKNWLFVSGGKFILSQLNKSKNFQHLILAINKFMESFFW